jgi:hypothetical protein
MTIVAPVAMTCQRLTYSPIAMVVGQLDQEEEYRRQHDGIDGLGDDGDLEKGDI